MHVWIIISVLNGMNSCELDDRECIYKEAHSLEFQGRGVERDYEIFEAIFELKSQFPMFAFHSFQKIPNILVFSENGFPVGAALPSRITV